jgi:hypothetical protein
MRRLNPRGSDISHDLNGDLSINLLNRSWQGGMIKPKVKEDKNKEGQGEEDSLLAQREMGSGTQIANGEV